RHAPCSLPPRITILAYSPDDGPGPARMPPARDPPRAPGPRPCGTGSARARDRCCDTRLRCRRALVASAPEFAHQSLQFTWQPAGLTPFSNLDARTPPGHEHRRLERGRVPQVRQGIEQGEIGVAIGRDRDDAQRVAMPEVGPRAVAHDEEATSHALRWIDAGMRAPQLIEARRVHHYHSL